MAAALRGDRHVKGGRVPNHILPQPLALAFVACVEPHHTELGTPLLKLDHPIRMIIDAIHNLASGGME